MPWGARPDFRSEPAPVWVFLFPAELPPKNLIYRYWVRLDFLGFSRANREISMGYAA
jgi:hypothetical protein